jgi:hypothetical protein
MCNEDGRIRKFSLHKNAPDDDYEQKEEWGIVVDNPCENSKKANNRKGDKGERKSTKRHQSISDILTEKVTLSSYTFHWTMIHYSMSRMSLFIFTLFFKSVGYFRRAKFSLFDKS